MRLEACLSEQLEYLRARVGPPASERQAVGWLDLIASMPTLDELPREALTYTEDVLIAGRLEPDGKWFQVLETFARAGHRSPRFNELLGDVVAGKVTRKRGRPPTRDKDDITPFFGYSASDLKPELIALTIAEALIVIQNREQVSLSAAKAMLAKLLFVTPRTINDYLKPYRSS